VAAVVASTCGIEATQFRDAAAGLEAVWGSDRNSTGASLNSLAEKFKYDVADHSGNHGDGEIRGGENIVEGERESLSLGV